MFEEEQICPYTGLRSFTEEESLYFKGREDDIDQATQQLQRNKFLMLTGASGDGKSSLIYAGIIPNARAGFLKSKYTQWCVADFRPERTPFQNLCKAIAKQLEIENLHSVQSELNHGFSAIIDLYKNSKRHIDTHSVVWQSADDAGKAKLKREAANLIILVDQFEEFFTNPENYHKGVPSVDANLVLNLLLETARIALEEDLPIYVVFTMRSDYIGQCAAFRGLPEYIGFSQFFVPRLNRTQLQQVIEEPAVLSGNRISRRLTERLIHDLTEGVDQLPILQHALNQIWHAADNGKEEMDLIHYAMVGGMPVNELPDERVDRFKKWFDELSPVIRSFYSKPNLQNVLDTHTNKLFEQATDYYTEKTGKTIPNQDVKAIIRTAFICLTKIDQSRAVRNRMTLKEIVNILGRPEYSTNDVGIILNIFREPGNTFIHPFILEDPNTHLLNEDDVLDITHESLIRNWEYLEQWAKEEFDNYTISLDFEQQLNRWVESEKSNDFLLPIGPLTYFENWFQKVKPNAHWIARYLPDEIEKDKKLTNAKQVLRNTEEFLAKSAKKHVVTRTIMRYGPKRIAAALAIVGIIVLSSFGIRDYFRKQNDNVLKSMKAEIIELANIPKLSLAFPIPAINEQLMLGNLTIPEVIEGIHDPRQQIKIVNGIATQLVYQGRNEPQKEILQSLTITDSLLDQLVVTNDSRELSEDLKQIHDLAVTSGMAYYLNQDESLKKIVINNAKRSARWALHIFKEQPEGFTDLQNLNLALENGINNKIYTQDEIRQLLNILSPFENKSRSPWVENNYAKDKTLARGQAQYGNRFNGLFQDLAYLYSAIGQSEMALQCIDSLLRYQENFYQNDYATHAENASHIAAVFYTYGMTDQLETFVNGYCQKKNISTVEFYNRLVSWALIDNSIMFHTNFYPGGTGRRFSNLHLKYSSDEMLSFFFQQLKNETFKIKDNNERNFHLAVFLKNEGCFIDYRTEIRGWSEKKTGQFYKEAINYYQQVSEEYLNQNISVIGTAGSDLISLPRKFLFLYPDYRVPFHPFEPRSIVQFYNSPAFIDYVLQNNLFELIYERQEDLRFFELWLLDYQIVRSSPDWHQRDPMSFSLMDRLAAKLEDRKANQFADLNILYLHHAEQAFDQGKAEIGIASLQKIQPDKLLNIFQYKNFGVVNSYSFELVAKSIANLMVSDQEELAYKLLNVFKKEVNRSSLYGYASQMVSLNKQSPLIALRLLDSARVEMKRLEDPAVFQPNRHQVAIALMYLDPEKNSSEAYQTIKNSFGKFQAIVRFSNSYAIQGELYKAKQQAPGLISAGDKTGFIENTIAGYNLTRELKEEWKKFRTNKFIFSRLFLPYIDENE